MSTSANPAHAPSTGPIAPPPWSPPTTFAEPLITDRLVIRRYAPGDEHALYDAISTSRDTLAPWLPWAMTNHQSLHDSIYDIVRFKRATDDMASLAVLTLGIFLRSSGTLVGGTGFHTIHRATGQAEIGYWTDIRQRRSGYCVEATRWMISWMLTPANQSLRCADRSHLPGWGFRRVEILCAGDNAASAGVPTKIGLRKEQHRRLDRWIDGRGWNDTLCWGVVDDEWDTEAQQMRSVGATSGSR